MVQSRLSGKVNVADISAAPKGMREALAELEAPLIAIYHRYLQPDAPVRLLADECKALLRSKSLVIKRQGKSWRLGVHPDNRYGDGVVPSDVLGLIGDIFGQGCSRAALQEPTACESPPPGHPRALEYLRFNNSVVDGSGGQLPPYEGELEGVTVTCGHTSMGNRCWEAGTPSDDERFSLDGRLSLERLKELQPSYHDVVTTGIEWDWIRWPVEIVHPWIPKLFQEAGNAGQQIARCESRLEVMLKIREVAARNARLHNGDAAWDKVLAEAKRGGSPFLAEMPHLVTYVKGLSGGLSNPFMLYELRDFVRQLQAQRVVKGQTLATIAELALGAEAAAPRFRLALVKAMASASVKYTKADEQWLFKSAELTSMCSKEKVAIINVAEAFLNQTREIADTSGITGPVRTSLLGLLDVRVAHFVCNKPDESRGTFKSFGDIGFKFCGDVATATGAKVASPWSMSAEQVASESKARRAAAPPSEVKEFSNKGNWLNSLEAVTAKGVKVDAHVAHYKTKEVFKVKAMLKGYVYMYVGMYIFVYICI